MSFDRLDTLLERFSMRADLFRAGLLCGSHLYEARESVSNLHLVKRGPVTIHRAGLKAVHVEEPSLIFLPVAVDHRFVTGKEGAELVCASVYFEGGSSNPVVQSLPPFFVVPLSAIEHARPVLDLLFTEAFSSHCGRRAAANRLFEVVIIHVLRFAMIEGHTSTGMLAGLGDRGLARALVAMHDQPGHPWTLDTLAAKAGMSRSRFAARFHEVVGLTPGNYLAGWRITVAQELLKKGRPLKLVADDVGYASAPALSRAFRSLTRLSPREWLNAK
jgi:AraC-like DNA-binding protein